MKGISRPARDGSDSAAASAPAHENPSGSTHYRDRTPLFPVREFFGEVVYIAEALVCCLVDLNGGFPVDGMQVQ
ncbi:hypothetical protein PLACP1_28320 [Planifilum fimeticola]